MSPTKNRAAVGGSLEDFILARNFQSHSRSRIFLIFGPYGVGPCSPFFLWNLASALDSWALKSPAVSRNALENRIFLQEIAFSCWRMHVLQESLVFCRKESACSLQENSFFCSLLWGVKNYEWQSVFGWLFERDWRAPKGIQKTQRGPRAEPKTTRKKNKKNSKTINYSSGSEKGVFWKRGLFRKVHFLEILENLEILEILENPPECGK